MSTQFTILYGSYLVNRNGIRIVKFIEKKLVDLGYPVNVVDAKELNIPMIEKRYVDYEPGQAPQVLQHLKQIYDHQTSAYIVVNGEYNGTIQPGLKNLLDFFYQEYCHRPCGIISYSVGPMGGIRASGHMRALLSTLGMAVIPKLLSFPEVTKQFDQEGTLLNKSFESQTDDFLQELSCYADALRTLYS